MRLKSALQVLVLGGDDAKGVGGVLHVVVEQEVVGGDDVNAAVLLQLPVGGAQVLVTLLQLLLTDLAGPVRLGQLLELEVGTHAGKFQVS